MKTLIIVPCYNEAKRLDTVTFLDFIRQHPHVELLFVNDGSTDTTADIINNMAQQSRGAIHVHHLNKNKGKAEAVRDGFGKGFNMLPEFIGFIDADLASPIETILDLEETLVSGHKDIAIAARVNLLGHTIKRNPLRHYIGRVFATAASIILNLPVYDTQCGAKLFRVNDRLKLVFNKPFTTRWIFDVEILARMIITEKNGEPLLKDICTEYPVYTWVDKKGSKLRLKDFITSARDLLKIWGLMRRQAW